MLYPDAANTDLLDRIPLTSGAVLDVGCGTGAMALAFKELNPGCVYFGVEADEQACLIAINRVDRLVRADIEQFPAPFGDTKFDCIIYGDVLEHLRDPWAVLQAHAELLNPGGVILICMPNVEHWSFAARLFAGTWTYERMGLLDSTHLRWFTFQTTRAAITAAGLVAHDVAARIFDAPACDAFVQAMAPALVAMGVDPAEYRGRAAPLQHVWRALRQPVERLNIVSSMLAHTGGVSEVRVVQPMRALATIPEVFSLVTSASPMPDFEADSAKIFILHRPLLVGEEGLATIRQLIALGFVVVCEFDDHPDFIPVLQRPDVQNFRAVHAVQTTTVPLAEVLAKRNPEVIVFPNAVDRLRPTRNFENPDCMTLFFGGINREKEWPELVGALNAVAALAGPRLRFEIVYDRGLFDALDTPHKNFTPLCDYETYLGVQERCEISFMPLRDTLFNRCKSDLKYLEAAAARLVPLASPTVYGKVIEDGRTGMIFDDAEELQAKLFKLLAAPQAAKAIADAARAHVAQQRMLAYQVAGRVTWYRSLWDRRHALNRALVARVPELAMQADTQAAWQATASNTADLGDVVLLPLSESDAISVG